MMELEVIWEMGGDCEPYNVMGVRARGHQNPRDFIEAIRADRSDAWDALESMLTDHPERFVEERVRHEYMVDVPMEKWLGECSDCGHPVHAEICGDADTLDGPCSCEYVIESSCSIWVPRAQAFQYGVPANEGYAVTVADW